MISLQTKDSNKKVRSLEINGFVKPSGTICAKVTNEKGAQYFVVVKAHGSCCTCEGNSKWGKQCYHLNAVKAALLPSYEEVTSFPLSEVMADADTAMREAEHVNPYDVLATTKDTVNNKVNPRTGMTDAEWQAYRNYEMGIGV